MESKTARLTLLIDPDKKAAFERFCASQDRTVSQVVRQLIREHLALHGVRYQTGGGDSAAASVEESGAPTPEDRGGRRAGT